MLYTSSALKLRGGGCSNTKVAALVPPHHDVEEVPDYLKRWRQLGGEDFDELLTGKFGEPGSQEERHSRPVRLVRARYLIELYRGRGRLQKRQTTGCSAATEEDRARLLPESAFIDMNELRQATLLSAKGASRSAVLPILVVSYPWLTREHPDPDGLHLARLGAALEVWFMGRGRDGEDASKSFGVFLDYASLYQHPRNDTEGGLFYFALDRMDLWYRHPSTTVFSLTTEHSSLATQYHDRGWCFFEWSISGMVKAKDRRLDLGLFDLDEHTEQRELVTACRAGRRPPLAPSTFEKLVQTSRLSFTNGNEDGPKVVDLQKRAFVTTMTSVDKLRYSDCAWDDADAAVLAEAIHLGGAVLENLIEFQLDYNRIGDDGATKLIQALATGAAPKLRWLYLNSNQIGDAGAMALADALAAGTDWSPALERLKLEGNPAMSEEMRERVQAALKARQEKISSAR